MKLELIWYPLPYPENKPIQYCMIYVVLLGGANPMMAQYNPQGWCDLTSGEVIKKGITHYLEPKTVAIANIDDIQKLNSL